MTRIGGCIAFLCRDIDRVEDVSEVGAGHLRAIIVPEQSDFGSGLADWRIEPFGDQSQVVYESEFEPAFFIPPLIGSHFVKRAVGKAVTTSFAKLECIARIQAGLTGVSPRELVDATPETMGGDAMSAALWDPIQGGTVLPCAGYDGRPVACRGVSAARKAGVDGAPPSRILDYGSRRGARRLRVPGNDSATPGTSILCSDPTV